MAEETVRSRVDGEVATITLASPARRNALGLDTLRALRRAIEAVPRSARVVVIDAEGPVFSAGHDISEMIDRSGEFYEELFADCTATMESLHRIPQPVIAKVHGPATAAGCQLVASCDLAVASERAWFATPGVKIGLFCTTPMVPVVRSVGPKRAMQMLLTGDPVDAATAVDWGLINMAVPAGELDAAVDGLIDKILRWSPQTIAIGKRAFYAQADLPEAAAYEVAQPIMASTAADDDAQEGMGAFLQKRPPRWTGIPTMP